MNAGAGNGIRTRDPNLGKVVLYQLSYSRIGPSTYQSNLEIVNSKPSMNSKRSSVRWFGGSVGLLGLEQPNYRTVEQPNALYPVIPIALRTVSVSASTLAGFGERFTAVSGSFSPCPVITHTTRSLEAKP